MHNFPLLEQSHAQPLPNLVIAAWANSSFMDSNDPNDSSIALAISPLGVPPPLGHMVFQNIEWFQNTNDSINDMLFLRKKAKLVRAHGDNKNFNDLVGAFLIAAGECSR